MRIITDINEKYPEVKALLYRLVEQGLTEDYPLIHRGRNRIGLTGGPDPLAVKAYKVRGAFKGYMYGLLRAPKARRAFRNARKLRSLGFDTPEPMGAVCVVDGGRLRESYYVCRYLEGWTFLRRAEERHDFPALARALAAYMDSLHRAGVLMKDFTQGNILFRTDGEGRYHFALVDINRMEFGVHDRRRLMSNFGAVLDTPEGVAVLAREYAALQSDPAAIEREANDIYRRHHIFLDRKHKLKKLLKG